MGKHKRRRRFGISVHNGRPGCMWGVFNVLNYQPWCHTKKRLAHKRHVDGDGSSGHSEASNAGNLQETSNSRMENSNVEEKVRQVTRKNKNSVKARIKALIRVEMCKRKGRHRRTSTYPLQSQLMQVDSVDLLETAEKDLLTEIELNNIGPQFENENHEYSYACSSTDLKLSRNSKEPTANEERRKAQYFDEKEKQQIENDMLLEENLDSVKLKEIIADGSVYRSKEFLEALDIINLNKDYFVKVLHDPSSPLALHFHNKQALSSKLGLTRCETFPMPSSSGKRDRELQVGDEAKDLIHSESMEYIHKQSMSSSSVVNRVGRLQKSDKEMVEICESSSSGSSPRVINHGAIKRVKDHKQNIKHAVKEGKNESHRITMDAVLHKIPHNQGLPTDSRKAILYRGKESGGVNWNDITSNLGKSRHQRLRRTSSTLSETLDRYSRLYENSFKREDGSFSSERTDFRREEEPLPSKSNQRSLVRICSLPELGSYFNQIEDSSDVFTSGMQFKAPTDGTVRLSSSINEEKIYEIPLASYYPSKSDTSVGSQIQDNFKIRQKDSVSNEYEVGSRPCAYGDANAKSGGFSDNINDWKTGDNECDKVQDIGQVTSKPDGPVLHFKNEEFRESTTGLSILQVAHGNDSEKVEIRSKHVNIDISQLVQVDSKDKAYFDYVRNVLELSGFNWHESLGTWLADYQPLDPSVLEEVEGCVLLDPNCSGNEGGNCNHLLLFDLINEVLMEIYERSYSYCPMRLSTLSHIHPMPAGHHVLEEVWAYISWYLRLTPEVDETLDFIVSRDMAKDNEWMNLQFDAECLGIELEELIFEDLLQELIVSI